MSFDPGTTVGDSPESVWVTGVNADGCEGPAREVVVTVTNLNVNFTAPADLCVDAGIQTNLGGGSPAGGT
jgi:hypothetical protein